MKICPTCSKEWNDEAKFCGGCGTSLADVAPTEDAAAAASKEKAAFGAVKEEAAAPEAAAAPTTPKAEAAAPEAVDPKGADAEKPAGAAAEQAKAAFGDVSQKAADLSADLKEKLAAFTGSNIDDLVTSKDFDAESIKLDAASEQEIESALKLLVGKGTDELAAEYAAEETAAFAIIEEAIPVAVEAEMVTIEVPETSERTGNAALLGALPEWDMVPPAEMAAR